LYLKEQPRRREFLFAGLYLPHRIPLPEARSS
jgi:hypothetical protein